MRQLDLFGSLFETPAPPEKKKEQEVAVAPPPPEKIAEAPATDFTIHQHSVLESVGVPAEEVKNEEISDPVIVVEREKLSAADEKEPSNPIFFTDGKIGVKMKAKPAAKPKETEKQEPEKVETKPAPAVHLPKAKKEDVKKVIQKRGRKSFKEIDAEVDLIEVPEDDILFQKQYYPISQVAKWFNVNTSLLRFWENEFEILKPRKNRKGDRMFRPEDVKNIQLIYELLRQKKYTVEGAKEYLKTNKNEADLQIILTQTLTKFRGFLLDLKANLGN